MIKVVEPFLYPWQKDIYDAIKEDNGRGLTYVVKASRQKGKSILAIMCLLYFAFKNANSIGYMLEPTLSQSRRVFKQLIKSIGGEESPAIKSSNATLLEIEFVNGSQIIFKSAEQREALRGATVKNSILVIDEAAYIEDDIFFVLDPIVDATKSPVLIISTPLFRSGEFYERYKRGEGGSDFVKSFDWSEYDTSALLDDEKLEYYRSAMTEMKFRSEILGLFLDELSYVFGDVGKNVGLSKKPAVYCGIDWSAGGGNDYTAVVFLDEDNHMTDLKYWRDFEPVELTETIAAIINEKQSLKRVQVEKNSLGHVYYDLLRKRVRKNLPITEFVTTNESKRRIIEQLIKGFETDDITILDDHELKRELQNYGVEKLKNGSYTYNGQNNVNDDMVIALALAYDLTPSHKKNNKIRIALI